MKADFDARVDCRHEGRSFKPDVTLTALTAKLPEMLRVPSGVVSEEACRVS